MGKISGKVIGNGKNANGDTFQLILKSGHYRLYKNNVNQELWRSEGEDIEDLNAAAKQLDVHSTGSVKITPKEPDRSSIPEMTEAQDTVNAANNEIASVISAAADSGEIDQRLANYIQYKIYKGANGLELLQKMDEDSETLDDKAWSELYGELPKVNQESFNKIFRSIKGEGSLYDTIKGIEEVKEKRGSVVEDLKEKSKDKHGLADRLVDHSDQMQEETDEFLETSKNQSSFLNRLLPGDDFKLNWNTPTGYDAAKEIWQKDFEGKTNYKTLGPFDQYEHNTAAEGHGAGSTSLESNETARGKARSLEDLEMMERINNLLKSSENSRRLSIEDIKNLGGASRDAHKDGIETSSKTMGAAFNQEGIQKYRQNVLDKDLAEGEINHINQSGEEDKLIGTLKQDKLAQQEQAAVNLNSNIANLKILAEEAKKGSAQSIQNYNLALENIWINREAVYRQLRAEGRGVELDKLQNSQNNKKEWMELIKGMAPIVIGAGLAIAGVATGSIPLVSAGVGIATKSPYIGEQAGKYFGESAKSAGEAAGGMH